MIVNSRSWKHQSNMLGPSTAISLEAVDERNGRGAKRRDVAELESPS